MKKSVAAALAAAAVIGVSSTSFAAIANPFTDVPAGHWAYQSIEKLRIAGIIDGYTDEYGRPNSMFRGDRNITRYEAAQMIARALAKNPTGANKAELDRLVAEFRDELDALGVRVANLEKYADKVIWHGKLEYTYHQFKTDPLNTGHKAKDTSNGYIFRFEPEAEVNDHWTLHARIDAEGDMRDDTTTNFSLVRGWAQGDYDKFQIKLGKFEFYPENEAGLIWDTEISGAELSFGSKWKFTVTGGRINDDTISGGTYGRAEVPDDLKAIGIPDNAFGFEGVDPATVVGLRVDYDNDGKGLFGGAGWYHIKDDDLAWGRTQYVENTILNGNTEAKQYNKANIWTVNLGYRFTDKLTLSGGYARNTKADWEKNSWQAELNYGDYEDASEKGQWSVWAGYRKYGTNVSFVPTAEDALLGTRGWIVGAAWAPFKNIGLIAKYFDGKYIEDGVYNSGHGKARHLFGRVEFFF
ncbi:MAG: S-layer homology domain-containing protein [Quinella sp. 2Q5]|nr:S-layer homology domain-containing protein [Quinella sp. 2Q5]